MPDPKAYSSDPELDLLIGTIRRRRAVHVARERAATTSAPVARPLGAGAVAATAPAPRPRSSAARALASAEAGVVLDVQPVSPSVRILRVARPKSFTFEAGQSVKLGLGSASVRRRYSIASAPSEEHLELCVERVPGGRLSSRLFELSPGDRVSLADAAKGDFLLRRDRREHVMVATGTGIAPLRSMLRDALSRASAAPQQFWVLHGASFADELPYADELAALARADARVRYVPTVSRPGDLRNRGWVGQSGRVDALVWPTVQARSKNDVAVYACGHPEMVRAVRERLVPLGYLVLDETFE